MRISLSSHVEPEPTGAAPFWPESGAWEKKVPPLAYCSRYEEIICCDI